MKALFLFLIVFLLSDLTVLKAQAWELHLNSRDAASIFKGETLSFLAKRKLNQTTYMRLGLSGYSSIYNISNGLGTVQKMINYSVLPGIERRVEVHEKFFFVYGIDSKYEHSVASDISSSSNHFSRTLNINYFGVSGFFGIHYQISPRFAILAETHLPSVYSFHKASILDSSTAFQTHRTEKMRQFNVNFLPFRYLTAAFTI